MPPTVEEAFDAAFEELNLADSLDDDGSGAEEFIEGEPEGDAEGDAEGEGDGEEDGEPDESDPEEEDEGEDEDGEGGSGSGDRVELKPGLKIVLEDGTEVSSDEVILFQRDYTKKTTALAEERRKLEDEREQFDGLKQQVEQTYEQMRDWYEARSGNPAAWVQEIALESGDPTRVVARALYDLGQAGALDPKFMETFGIEAGPVAEVARDSAAEDRIAELEAKLQAQEQEREQQSRVREKVAQYQAQWDTIKSSTGLEFDSAESETEAKRELMEFARAKNLTGDLVDAYLLMQAVKGQSKQDEAPPAPDPQVTKKKRALKAVNPRSSGGGRPAGKKAPADTRSAVLESLAEFGL